ncbi:uncharacterized protein LOC126837520 [Adelges cooleyi]|uniref:uncharacterized protein LOC126837520 n=1 Tax=Adelges cooleyi TaxID=133065 RepID=UPI00217F8E0B|nr:uncharacterized protein LOC126837520 [Adelges cooleyi]
MYSHFSVILLCLSGVYCISSRIDNLEWEELNEILKGQTDIEEWSVTMDQYILKKNDDGSKTPFHVGNALEKFAHEVEVDESALEKFGSIHDTIKTAYQCALAKYTSLANFLIVQDILMVRKLTDDAVDYVNLSEEQDINTLFRQTFHEYSKERYHLDFDVNVDADQFNILTKHGYDTKQKQEIHNIFFDMIRKEIGVNIRHKTYPDVLKANLPNQHEQERVETLNKLICVLNESIMLLDNFIVDKCVEHEGNFVKNFESLKNGVTGDLMWLLHYYDEQKARGAVELYSDFTRTHPIGASGCFVENLEIKVAGLQWDLPNNNIPTIYGPTAYRQTETNYKIIPTTNPSPGGSNVAMVLFRDPDTSFENMYRPSSSRGVQRLNVIVDASYCPVM